MQIHSEIDHFPDNALLLVLLLLQDEHEVIKELLKLLIREVDTQLLEAIVLKSLETGNVQDTDKMGALVILGVQRQVDDLDEPVEAARIDGLAQSLHGIGALVLVLALVDELVFNLDLGSR